MKRQKFAKRIALGLVCLLAVLMLVFAAGRWGWKLFGFRACQSARIDHIEVTENAVCLQGGYPGIFSKGFLGYYCQEEDGVLYIGFRFSDVFGIFETGVFDITVPTRSQITRVCMKTRYDETVIWEKNTPEPVPEETLPQETEPVRPLTSVSPESLPTVHRAGENVLLCWSDFEGSRTTLALLDIQTDTVLRAVELEGVWSLLTESFSDGGFALSQRESGTWQFLDGSLNTLGFFHTDSMDGLFSHDRRTYYSLQNHVLCSTDVQSGSTVRTKLPEDLRFTELLAIYPESETLVMRVLLSPFSTECGTAIVDLEEQTFCALCEERYQPYISENHTSLFLFDDETMEYSVYYRDSAGLFRVIPPQLLQSAGEVMAVRGGAYLLGIAEETKLFALDGDMTVCSLADYGITGEFRGGCCLGDTLVGGVYREGAFRMYAVALSELTFEAFSQPETAPEPALDESLVYGYWGEGVLPETLQDARDYADALEQRYGVKILLSAECEDAAARCSISITTSDKMELTNEARDLCRALEGMERAFRLYPEGFFRQFRNAMGECGLCFLLVGEIKSDFTSIGVCYGIADWQYIALDVRMDAVEATVCHELWHATENKICQTQPQFFADWDAYNPEGFSYSQDATDTYSNQFQYTLFRTGGEGLYFVDAYARVNPKEDRARLMEYIMTSDAYAEELAQSPFTAAKLERMAQGIYQAFDTSTWEDIRWERFEEE